MVQLTKTGLRTSPDAMIPLKDEFRKLHTFQLKSFLAPDLLQEISSEIAASNFYERSDLTHKGKEWSREQTMDENLTVHKLRLLMNNASLWDFVRSVTGCEEIRCFYGRVYRIQSGGGHYDNWHNDVDDIRLIGMSLNLSPEPYEGGTFRLREFGSQTVLRDLPNTGPGDAIFFRISDQLEHIVTRIEGERPKIAFAGWFQNSPYFADLMRETYGK
jgi:hypothetical protein